MIIIGRPKSKSLCGRRRGVYKFTHAADWQAQCAGPERLLGCSARSQDYWCPGALILIPRSPPSVLVMDLEQAGIAFDSAYAPPEGCGSMQVRRN